MRIEGATEQRHHQLEQSLPSLGTRPLCLAMSLVESDLVEGKWFLEDERSREPVQTSGDERRAAEGDVKDAVHRPPVCPGDRA